MSHAKFMRDVTLFDERDGFLDFAEVNFHTAQVVVGIWAALDIHRDKVDSIRLEKSLQVFGVTAVGVELGLETESSHAIEKLPQIAMQGWFSSGDYHSFDVSGARGKVVKDRVLGDGFFKFFRIDQPGIVTPRTPPVAALSKDYAGNRFREVDKGDFLKSSDVHGILVVSGFRDEAMHSHDSISPCLVCRCYRIRF